MDDIRRRAIGLSVTLMASTPKAFSVRAPSTGGRGVDAFRRLDLGRHDERVRVGELPLQGGGLERGLARARRAAFRHDDGRRGRGSRHRARLPRRPRAPSRRCAPAPCRSSRRRARRRRARSRARSGGSSRAWRDRRCAPRRPTGYPAFGITETGTATDPATREKTSSVSWGPIVQFIPTTSAPAAARAVSASVASSPKLVLPSARKVIEATIGIPSERARAARSASMASSVEENVSKDRRSTPLLEEDPDLLREELAHLEPA